MRELISYQNGGGPTHGWTSRWNGSDLSHDVLETQAASLRAQIRELHSRLAEVISLQNTLVPVGRIPNEILLDLFTLFTPSLFETRYDKNARNVSQVCRRWRRLALSLPGLWTRISLRNHPEHIRSMLARSSGGPVAFDALSDTVPVRNCELLAAEAHRLWGIALGRMPQAYPTRCSEDRKSLRMALTSTVLEELFLSSMDLRDQAREPADVDEHVVVPTMRRLVLSNTLPNPAFLRPFVNTVTHFSFSGIQIACLSTHWHVDVIRTLALMPHLQSLTMSHTSNPKYSQTFPDVTPVPLPRLVLFVADHVALEHLAVLITALEATTSPRFRLHTYGSTGLSQLRAPSLLDGARSLSLTCIPPASPNPVLMVVRGYSGDVPSLDIAPKTEITFLGTMAQLPTYLADLSAFTRACGGPKLETCELVGLYFSLGEQGADTGVGKGLPPCVSLRLVRCSLAVVTTVLEALGGRSTEASYAAPFCEDLRRLEVCGLHDEGEGSATVVRELLARMADRREEMGAAPLTRVVVTGMSRLDTR